MDGVSLAELLPDECQIEATTRHRRKVGARSNAKLENRYEFYVKWKGFPSSENTWEPASHFVDPKLVKDYLSMSGGSLVAS